MIHHLPFTKMHGLGNDFVVIESLGTSFSTEYSITSQIAQQLCDRRFGVGADQILWLRKPENPSSDIRMEILNADGSTAEMCGNGIRAAALYLNQYGPFKKTDYLIETLGGLKKVRLQKDEVEVDMGVPVFNQAEFLQLENQSFQFYEVNMGNPHAVIFVDDLSQVLIEKWGPQIESHPRFPKRTNVEFVQVIDHSSIRVRVWERGAGPTLACGTGACAAAIASIATEKVKSSLDVYLPGGKLKISWQGKNQPVLMTGPAQEVFQGKFFLDDQLSDQS